MSRNTHVTRRGAVYQFRMRVPADLISHFKKKEITFSLRTKDQKEANRLAHAESLRWLDEFDSARRLLESPHGTTMTPELIDSLANDFHVELLEEDESIRRDRLSPKDHRFALNIVRPYAKDIVSNNRSRDNDEGVRWFANHVRQEAELLNITVAPGSDLQNALIYAFAIAASNALDVIDQRDAGIAVPTPKRVTMAALSIPQQTHNDHSISLSTVIEKYSLEQINSKRWTEKTASENRAVFDLLISIIGDIWISDLGFPHVRQFKETIQVLPPNLNKSPRYRGKTIAEILEMSDVKPIGIATVNKYLTRLSSLLHWACVHGYAAKNYAEGISISQPGRKASDERAMFEEHHLTAIFKAIAERRLTSSGNVSNFHYWAPLLAYTTGARVNEIASLRLCDIKVTEAVPYISINQQNDGASTKTLAGRRDIPIHPSLIRLGLVQHVKTLTDAGETKLFPDLRLTKHKGYGAKITSWFSGHDSRADGFLRREAAVTDQNLSFHSFRHTMATLLERAEISDVLQKRILGHSLKGDVTSGRYSKGPLLGQTLAAITKAIPETPLRDMPEYSKWVQVR